MSARRIMMSDNDLVSDIELSELVSDSELESDIGLVSDSELESDIGLVSMIVKYRTNVG